MGGFLLVSLVFQRANPPGVSSMWLENCNFTYACNTVQFFQCKEVSLDNVLIKFRDGCGENSVCGSAVLAANSS